MHFGKNRVDNRCGVNKRDLKLQLDEARQKQETNFNLHLRQSMWSLSITWMRDYITRNPRKVQIFSASDVFDISVHI